MVTCHATHRPKRTRVQARERGTARRTRACIRFGRTPPKLAERTRVQPRIRRDFADAAQRLDSARSRRNRPQYAGPCRAQSIAATLCLAQGSMSGRGHSSGDCSDLDDPRSRPQHLTFVSSGTAKPKVCPRLKPDNATGTARGIRRAPLFPRSRVVTLSGLQCSHRQRRAQALRQGRSFDR